jgi:hypothetical protein
MVQIIKGDIPLAGNCFDLAATIENTDPHSVLLYIATHVLDCTDAGVFQH